MRVALYLALLPFFAGCSSLPSRPPGEVRKYDTSWEHYPEVSSEVAEAAGPYEREPKLVGGLEGVQRRVDELDKAQRCPYSGEVIVEFVADEEGGVAEAQLAQGIGDPCDAIVLEVVQEMRFIPALINGRAVKTKFMLPISFY